MYYSCRCWYRAFCVTVGVLCVGCNTVDLPRAAETKSDKTVVIHAGRLLTKGRADIALRQTIVVSEGRIAEIANGFLDPGAAGYSGARLVNLRHSFVMPGLIDTHVHLSSDPREQEQPAAGGPLSSELRLMVADNARRLLLAGFTTVMDMGTGTREHERAVFSVRDSIRQDARLGPEILAAGSPISAPGHSRMPAPTSSAKTVPAQGECSGLADCERKVRRQVARGADFINVYHTGSLLAENSAAWTFTREELARIIGTAHEAGKAVVMDGGNSPGDASATHAAIAMGADIVDTLTFPGDETFSLLAQEGVYFAPHVYALQAAVGDTPDSLGSGSMGWLPVPILEKLFALKQLPSTLPDAHRAGVRFVLAADSGVFAHGHNAREIEAYVQLGIPAAIALEAATQNAAMAHRIAHRTGSIEVGKEADIIAFSESPLDSVATLRNPVFIMSNGVIVLTRF